MDDFLFRPEGYGDAESNCRLAEKQAALAGFRTTWESNIVPFPPEAPMILPRLTKRTDEKITFHPIWQLGFFDRYKAFVVFQPGHAVTHWAWYPEPSWHAALTIYRAFSRQFEK
jgi:hypothetical protein